MNTSSSAKNLIFILGITPRSGTNFLYDLLCLHPHCTGIQVAYEDYVIQNTHFLESFAHACSFHWKRWDSDGQTVDKLSRQLSQAITDYLTSLTTTSDEREISHAVCKTPSVRGLSSLNFYPNSKFIVLARDGRSVVESGMRTFGWKFDAAIELWSESAALIAKGAETELGFLLVRYEDILRHQQETLSNVFTFCGLDGELYDFSSAANAPVRGSSTYGVKGIEWSRVNAVNTGDFNPLGRSSDWSSWQHCRFNWIAGGNSLALGYELKLSSGILYHFTAVINNLFFDFRRDWRTPRRMLRHMLQRLAGWVQIHQTPFRKACNE